MEYLIQSSSFFKEYAKKEILCVFPRTKFKDVYEGNFISKLSIKPKEMLKMGKKSIFINNLFPIITQIQSSDIDTIVKKAYSKLLPQLNKKKTFRIETITHGSNIPSRDLEVSLGTKLEGKGYLVDLKEGEQIICILSLRDKYIFGLVNKKDAVYTYINQSKRFSKENNRLNRAQFKLIEAIERFSLNLSGGIAIDIGASPGGWTRVLVDRGYKVYAVDPAELDKSVKNNPHVYHIKKRIEDYSPKEKADLVVNDMNINPLDSAKMLEEFAPNVKSKAYVIFTLKLTNKKPLQNIKTVSRLLKSYKLVKVKHLFQNRRELTILLQRE